MSSQAQELAFASLLRGGGGATAPSPASISPFKAKLLPRIKGRAKKKEGRAWEVCIIRAGVSKNGLNYSEDVLREAVPIFESLPVYAYRWGDKINHLSDEAREQQPRGFSGNVVGRIEKAWWNEETKSIDGLLGVVDEPTRAILKNAAESGSLGEGVERPLLGLSIDAEGLREGQNVTRIVRGHSVDLVTRPAAGGELKRIVAALEGHSATEDDVKLEKRIADLEASLKRLQEEGVKEQSPLDDLRKALEGMSEEDRARFAGRVMSMLRTMGLAGGAKAAKEGGDAESRASKEDADKFQKLAAGVRKLMEADDVASVRRGLGELLEDIDPQGEQPDARDQQIENYKRLLRRQALTAALAPLIESIEIDGKPHRIVDEDAVARLVDLGGVSFKESDEGAYQVDGLEDAVRKLVSEKAWLVEAKSPKPEGKGKQGKQGKAGKGGEAAAAQSAFRLTEEHDPGNPTATLEKRIMQLGPRLAVSDPDAITEIRMLRQKLAAGA